MWLLSVSFIDDPDRGCLGRPPFLGKQPILKLHPEAEGAQEMGQDPPAIAPPPPHKRQQVFHTYRCPVCGKEHQVNPARHNVGWGRQLTCSCACEIQRRKAVRRKWRNMQRNSVRAAAAFPRASAAPANVASTPSSR
jgi:transcription elongation factor Elf1